MLIFLSMESCIEVVSYVPGPPLWPAYERDSRVDRAVISTHSLYYSSYYILLHKANTRGSSGMVCLLTRLARFQRAWGGPVSWNTLGVLFVEFCVFQFVKHCVFPFRETGVFQFCKTLLVFCFVKLFFSFVELLLFLFFLHFLSFSFLKHCMCQFSI